MRIARDLKALRGRGADVAVEVLEARQMLSGGGQHHARLAHLAIPAVHGVAQAKGLKHGKQHNKHAAAAKPAGLAVPTGFSADRLRHAYGVDNVQFGSVVGDGSGMTIAIVDAYHHPTIAQDLHEFSTYMGLPDVPSLRIVNQDGGTTLPSVDPASPSISNWETEIALDVETVHLMAPGANILLVECNSDDFADLVDHGVNWARQQPGVVAITMSWGAPEWNTESVEEDQFFTTPPGHAPVAFFSATGDFGSPGYFPAFSPRVVAVGGTSLNAEGTGNYLSETGWPGSGGGIATYEFQPAFQQGVVTQSTQKRTTPDVAFAADPLKGGLSVRDSYNNDASTPGPWQTVGGTSLGTPAWAALTAIADQGRALAGLPPLDSAGLLARLYSLPAADFHDVTSGSNGGFTAAAGYDLVTGLGTPITNMLVPHLASGGPFAFMQNGAASSAPVSAADVHFSTSMDTASFTLPGGIASFTGPGGADLSGAITGFSWLDSQTLRITFTPQTQAGAYVLSLKPSLHAATGTAMDQNGNYVPGEATDGFTGGFSIVAAVTGRSVFYNNSSYDGANTAANVADDGAIATDKSALLPGQTATFANYTSYSRGINGIMLDVAALGNGAALTAADFTFKAGVSATPDTWAAAPAPSSITVRPGAGFGGADRVTITWADNAIQNKWLQITMKATANTGLAAPDVFYFGNMMGETGNSATTAQVTIADIGLVRSQNGQAAGITSAADFNRSGQITIADVGLAQANNGQSIPLLAAPVIMPAPAPAAGAPIVSGSGTGAVALKAVARKHKGRHLARHAAERLAVFSTKAIAPVLQFAHGG
jgi:hypothetical protein